MFHQSCCDTLEHELVYLYCTPVVNSYSSRHLHVYRRRLTLFQMCNIRFPHHMFCIRGTKRTSCMRQYIQWLIFFFILHSTFPRRTHRIQLRASTSWIGSCIMANRRRKREAKTFPMLLHGNILLPSKPSARTVFRTVFQVDQGEKRGLTSFSPFWPWSWRREFFFKLLVITTEIQCARMAVPLGFDEYNVTVKEHRYKDYFFSFFFLYVFASLFLRQSVIMQLPIRDDARNCILWVRRGKVL